VQPFFAHDIIRKVKEAGGKPFLTDTTTYYRAHRNNAYDHMHNALQHGFNMAPFIVADGLRGENYRTIRTKGILKEIEVAGAIAEADSMIIITHLKGHELAGFGGAIKKSGHGLYITSWQTSTDTEWWISKLTSQNVLDAENATKHAKCTCQKS